MYELLFSFWCVFFFFLLIYIVTPAVAAVFEPRDLYTYIYTSTILTSVVRPRVCMYVCRAFKEEEEEEDVCWLTQAGSARGSTSQISKDAHGHQASSVVHGFLRQVKLVRSVGVWVTLVPQSHQHTSGEPAARERVPRVGIHSSTQVSSQVNTTKQLALRYAIRLTHSQSFSLLVGVVLHTDFC